MSNKKLVKLLFTFEAGSFTPNNDTVITNKSDDAQAI